MKIDREHILQGHLVRWVREAVPGGEFFAFDRSAAYGQWSHARQKARGVRKGTPDTLLCVAEKVPIWCELKAPGEEPDDAQKDIGRKLRDIGHYWFWSTTIEHYWRTIAGFGVYLVPNAEFLALHHDGLVATVIAKAEAKASIGPRRRADLKPSPAKVRRMAATGVWAR